MLLHLRQLSILSFICSTLSDTRVSDIAKQEILLEGNGATGSEIHDPFYTYTRLLEIPKNLRNNYNDVGLYNTTVWIASCGRKYENGRNCSLIVNNIIRGSGEELRKCKFNLRANLTSSEIAPYLRVFRINTKKFLVTWILHDKKVPIEVAHVSTESMQVSMFVKFIIVDSSSCNIRETSTTGTPYKSEHLDVKVLQAGISIHLSENGFSVFYPYSEYFDIAQETFDGSGNRIRGPVGKDNFSSYVEASVIASYSNDIQSENCFSVMRTQELFRTMPNSQSERVSPQPLTMVENLRGYSTTNGNVSSCRVSKKDVYSWSCSQRNLRGKEVEFTLSFDYQTDIFMIYNMPGGGLLTLTNRGSPYSYDSSSNAILVTRFDANGRAYKSVPFVDIGCTHSALLGHFFQHEISGIYCLSFLWKHSHFENLIKCYSEEFLTEIAE